MIAAGEHPKSIQTRLGHSSIQVTIDRYGHLMNDLDRQTAARLDAIAATIVAQAWPKTHRDSPCERAERPVSWSLTKAETPAQRGFLPTDSPEANTRSPDGI